MLYEKLKEYNVFARRYFYPLVCDFACYQSTPVLDPLTVARGVAERIVTIPIYDGLELDDVEKICRIILKINK
jgi:dTDP-4-amino-4,6-dideoxygalactose transaminase